MIPDELGFSPGQMQHQGKFPEVCQLRWATELLVLLEASESCEYLGVVPARIDTPPDLGNSSRRIHQKRIPLRDAQNHQVPERTVFLNDSFVGVCQQLKRQTLLGAKFLCGSAVDHPARAATEASRRICCK
jgi:hypothetical protein